MLLASERIESPTIARLRGTSSGSTSQYSSEDWVQQADSLTIDSPSIHSNPTFGQIKHAATASVAVLDGLMVRAYYIDLIHWARYQSLLPDNEFDGLRRNDGYLQTKHACIT